MNFNLSNNQREIVDAVSQLCARFDAAYWRDCDANARFPEEFVDAVTGAGWLGIAMPEAYGGAGLGITEAALLAHRITRSGAGMSGASAIHMNLFGPHPIVVFGTEEQKSRFLPPLITGKERTCFGVTEPDAGLNTAALDTRAKRIGDHYLVNGRKLWTTTAQTATHIMLVTRTTPLADCKKPTDGLSLFYTPLDRERIEVRRIPKMGRAAVDSNALFIDNLEVPVENLIGEEGDGWQCLLHGLNPERILVAAEAIGIGQAAIEKAANYARERIVFDRPIGKNQAIAHPMAECWMELEAAWLMTCKAASLYDNNQPCAVEANAAKYLAAEAAF